MPSEFSRELRKLEVRFQDYERTHSELVKQVKECIRLLKELVGTLEKREATPGSETIEELRKLRRKVIKSLSQVLKSEGSLEHERSHIFESYGALILCLEEEPEKLKS